MSDDHYAERRRLTFEQAEGAEALPTQLRTKELSQEVRALLWRAVHESLAKNTRAVPLTRKSECYGEWETILYDKHTLRDHKMADDFKSDADALKKDLKLIFELGNYVAVFGFLQFVLRHQDCPYEFPDIIELMLRKGGAAYRVLDRRTIVPIASEAEKATLERAIADLAANEFLGARRHLHSAGSELTRSNYASSIRESIHAVESVARTLAPSGSLGEALGHLERSAAIHGALKRGFLAIYGYTSDEKGIRHPLLDDPQANVDEADALFMLGACAAFVSYMINKARSADP